MHFLLSSSSLHAFVTIHETANGAVTTNGSVEWDNAIEREMVVLSSRGHFVQIGSIRW